MARHIDQQASTITIRTRAKGMLSRLAHDLEMEASRYEGKVTVDGDNWRAELSFDVAGLRVVGALRGDRVDRAVLSNADRAEIERRIANDVLPTKTVAVSAEGDRRRLTATIKAPKGEQRVTGTMEVEERRDGELVGWGKLTASLRKLGIAEIKGPLGAFRVDDQIELGFWLMLSPDG